MGSEYGRDDSRALARADVISPSIVPCRHITIPYLVRPTSAVFANDEIPVRVTVLTEYTRDKHFLVL